MLSNIKWIQQRETNSKIKFTISHTPTPAFVYAHVHSNIIAVYKTTWKARIS